LKNGDPALELLARGVATRARLTDRALEVSANRLLLGAHCLELVTRRVPAGLSLIDRPLEICPGASFLGSEGLELLASRPSLLQPLGVLGKLRIVHGRMVVRVQEEPAVRSALERAKARLDGLALYPTPVRIARVRVVVWPWLFRLTWLRRVAGGLAPHLRSGQVILSGSFTRPVHAEDGDLFHADYGPLGTVGCLFASGGTP